MTAHEQTRVAQMVDRYESKITELEKRPTWDIVKKACRTPDDEFDCSAEYCEPEKNGCPLVRGALTAPLIPKVGCENELHNIQVEADGRCHWCESGVKK